MKIIDLTTRCKGCGTASVGAGTYTEVPSNGPDASPDVHCFTISPVVFAGMQTQNMHGGSTAIGVVYSTKA